MIARSANDGYSCPIALALSELDVFKNEDPNKSISEPMAQGPDKWEYEKPRVLVQNHRAWKWKSTVGYKLPLEAKAFIWSFDNRKPVTPFEFEIDLNKPKYR